MYSVPGQGDYAYAGYAATIFDIKTACLEHDQDRPLFRNMRDGDWFMEFHLNRLKKSKALSAVAAKYEHIFNIFKRLPRMHIPDYWITFINSVK